MPMDRRQMKKYRTSSSKAGLVFPVARTARHLKSGHYANRISVGASVYMSAVLEYLVTEVMALAGEVSRQHMRLRIIPRHIVLAVANDDELKKLMSNAILSHGGVEPTTVAPEGTSLEGVSSS